MPISTKEFIIEDQSKTLFPTKMSRLLVEHGEKLIQEHISKCFLDTETAYSFMPQQRVHAAKTGLNLRRTVKLDPVAEYYVYDVVPETGRDFVSHTMHRGYISDIVSKEERHLIQLCPTEASRQPLPNIRSIIDTLSALMLPPISTAFTTMT